MLTQTAQGHADIDELKVPPNEISLLLEANIGTYYIFMLQQKRRDNSRWMKRFL